MGATGIVGRTVVLVGALGAVALAGIPATAADEPKSGGSLSISIESDLPVTMSGSGRRKRRESTSDR